MRRERLPGINECKRLLSSRELWESRKKCSRFPYNTVNTLRAIWIRIIGNRALYGNFSCITRIILKELYLN